MKITKTHVAKYLTLRSNVKAYEVEMTGLKETFMTALKEQEERTIKTKAGQVTLVTKEVKRLDEAKLMKALGVVSLDAFKTPAIIESVLVTAA